MRFIAIALIILGVVAASAKSEEPMPVLKQIIPQGTWPGVNKAIALRGDWMAMSVAGDFAGDGNRIEIWKKTNGVWALHTTFSQGFSQFRPNQGLCASSLDFDSTAMQLVAGDPRYFTSGPATECGLPNRRGICEENFVVFVRSGDTWTREVSMPVIPALEEAAGCDRRFGRWVQIEGDTVIVGAPAASFVNECGYSWGYMAVYSRVANAWTRTSGPHFGRHGGIFRVTTDNGLIGQTVLLGSGSLAQQWFTVGFPNLDDGQGIRMFRGTDLPPES